MVTPILRKLPIPALGFIKSCLPRNSSWAELVDNIRMTKFIEETNLCTIDTSGFPPCIIDKGDWEYPLLNVCFLENMLKNIVFCLCNGYRPHIAWMTPENQCNLWEELFLQPYVTGQDLQIQNRCEITSAPLYFPNFPTSEDVFKYGKLYQAFVHPNPFFKQYYESEFAMLLKGRRVLGVLCRGTDYVATKPKNHPIQPRVEDVIHLVAEKMVSLKCDCIYLATEEQAIDDMFESAFPGKIIRNTRKYFDSYHQLHQLSEKTLISAVHFDRENDRYLKSLEYFSSIFLLSKCTALIAGSCGGSRAALYLNYGQYEYSHLFNLGVY